ncbi:MAG: hypothetical protein MZV49_10420 [Rhodopseudomonas palustris]|nr:hypothetical protein [Rhodopseudomonas palustris]
MTIAPGLFADADADGPAGRSAQESLGAQVPLPAAARPTRGVRRRSCGRSSKTRC